MTLPLLDLAAMVAAVTGIAVLLSIAWWIAGEDK